jgi:hypothetical protein
MSDYTNGSGPATTYATYVLEDGNKVSSKSTVAAQTTANPDGTKTVKFIAVENFVGGTGASCGPLKPRATPYHIIEKACASQHFGPPYFRNGSIATDRSAPKIAPCRYLPKATQSQRAHNNGN